MEVLKRKKEEMLSREFNSFQNPLSIYLSHKNLPFLSGKYACGSPATGCALNHRDKARPILDNLDPHQQARVLAWLPGTLNRPAPQKSEVPMFNSIFSSEHETDSEKNQPRMPFISWTERMSVDVKLLDNDHKKLAILITDLHDGIVAGHSKQTLERAFEGVVAHVRIHFAHEEQLFAETGYPDAAIHVREHDKLMVRVKDLQTRFKYDTETASYMEVVNLLKGWFFGHIQSSDQEYAPHFKARGAGLILAAQENPVRIMRERPALRPRVVQGSWSA